MKLTRYKELGEEVWQERLYNGLQVIVIPKRRFSLTFAMLAVRCGSSDLAFSLDGSRSQYPPGLAHFLEHMLFYMPYGQAEDAFAANGAFANAVTGESTTTYYFHCSERFEQNLAVLLDFVTTPYFQPESVEKERSIIAREIRMGEDQPERRVYRNLMQALYEHHPIRDSMGTVESIAGVTPAMLEAYYRAFYTPENMVLCVSGNVEPETVRRVAMESFHAKSTGLLLRDYGEAEGPLPGRVRAEESMAVSQPLFRFGAKLFLPGEGHERARERLVGDMACELLAGGSSPLFERLYSEGLVDTGFYGGVSDFLLGAYVDFGGESKDPAAVLERVSEEAAALAESGGEALFERLKRARLGSFIRVMDDVDSLCQLGARGYFRGCPFFEERELLLSVTMEDVRAFLREKLALERIALSVVRPKETVKGA